MKNFFLIAFGFAAMLFISANASLSRSVLAKSAIQAEQLGAPHQIFRSIATKTPTRTPTRTQQIPIYRFNLNSANRILPANILQEVAFFGTGGEPTHCIDIRPGNLKAEKLTVSKAELYKEIEIVSCGWKRNDQITVTITDPSGAIRRGQGKAQIWGIGDSGFVAVEMYVDMVGTYKFSFQGPSGKFDWSVSVTRPKGARFHSLAPDKLVFYGLRPNENIKLFAYAGDFNAQKLVFKGHLSFQANAQGDLIVQASSDYYYFAIGDLSGNLDDGNGSRLTRLIVTSLSENVCPNAVKSRVSVGMQARTTIIDGTITRVRSGPSTSNKVTMNLKEGVRFEIIDGPRCSDGFTWWQIRIPNKGTGWVAEGSKSRYYIEPIP